MWEQSHQTTVRRLNPFAFPAETDLRFSLLVVAAVMLIVWIGIMLPAFFEGFLDLPLGFTSVDYPSFEQLPDYLTYEETLIEHRANMMIYLSREFVRLALPLGVLLLLFVIAAAIYYSHPQRIRRRFPSEPLTQHKDRDFQREIWRIMERTDLPAQPKVEVGKSLRLTEGQAYGYENDYVLRVDGGLRIKRRTAPHAVEAVVLHELGHIANQDVGRYYFSKAIWLAMSGLAFVPVTIGLIYGTVKNLIEGRMPSFSIIGFLAFQLAAGWGLVWAILTSLLRIREKYADWRAALWGGESSLIHRFTDDASAEEVSVLKRPWRRHPTVQERMDALFHPEKLFRVGWDLPFVLGAVMAFLIAGMVITANILGSVFSAVIVIGNISLVLADLDGAILLSLWILELAPIATMILLLLPFIGISYIVAGTLGLQVQREAVADLAVGNAAYSGYLQLWLPAALMSLGLEVGFLITPLFLFSPVLALTGTLALDPVLMVVLSVGTAVLTWFCLCYARFSAQRVLGAHAGESPPTSKRRALTLTFIILLWAFYIPLIFGRLVILQGSIVPGLFLGIARIGLIAGGMLYVAALGVTWLLMRIWKVSRPPRCPACDQVVSYDHLVAKKCAHCKNELAPWLFAGST